MATMNISQILGKGFVPTHYINYDGEFGKKYIGAPIIKIHRFDTRDHEKVIVGQLMENIELGLETMVGEWKGKKSVLLDNMKRAEINFYDSKQIKRIVKNIKELRKLDIVINVDHVNEFIKTQYVAEGFGRLMDLAKD